MAVPELFKAYSVALLSLLAGAAVVHNVYKPDLVGLHAAMKCAAESLGANC
jgi:hypothetical protein